MTTEAPPADQPAAQPWAAEQASARAVVVGHHAAEAARAWRVGPKTITTYLAICAIHELDGERPITLGRGGRWERRG